MKSLILAIAAVLLIMSVVTPAVSAQTTQYKVVIYSMDGARPDFVRKWASGGLLPNLAKLINEGTTPDYALTVEPSVTAVAHTAISTGTYPAHSGITGNTMPTFSGPIAKFTWPPTSSASGFDSRYMTSEPIWTTVVKAGEKVTIVNWPANWPQQIPGVVVSGFNPTSLSSNLFSTEDVSGATKVTLSPAAGNWTGLPSFASSSPPLETSFTVRLGAAFAGVKYFGLVLDTQNDGKVNYNTVYITKTRDASSPVAVLDKTSKKWSSPIYQLLNGPFEGRFRFGFYFALVNLSDDAAKLRIYQSFGRASEGYLWTQPDTLADNLLAAAGPIVTGGDRPGLERGWYSLDFYLETVRVSVNWFTNTTAWLQKNTDWNLFMTYEPWTDDFEHEMLAYIMPYSPRFDASKNATYTDALVRVYQAADEMLGVILKNIDSNTHVIVVSDHGFVPIWKEFYVNNVLLNNGLLALNLGTKNVNFTATQAYYLWDGHIMINKKNFNNYTAIQSKVISLLTGYRDKETGERIVDLALPKQQAAAVGLGGDRTGDVIISLVNGYHYEGAIRTVGVEVEPIPEFDTTYQGVPIKVSFAGYHGYAPYNPELWATTILWGPLMKKGETIPPVKLVDIAPTTALILGITEHPAYDGSIIEKALTVPVETLLSDKATVASLQSELTQLQGAVSDLQASVTNARVQITSFQSDLNSARGTIASLQLDVNSARSTVTTLQSQVTSLNNQVADYQNYSIAAGLGGLAIGILVGFLIPRRRS